MEYNELFLFPCSFMRFILRRLSLSACVIIRFYSNAERHTVKLFEVSDAAKTNLVKLL